MVRYTNKVVHLSDNEMATLTRSGFTLSTAQAKIAYVDFQRAITEVDEGKAAKAQLKKDFDAVLLPQHTGLAELPAHAAATALVVVIITFLTIIFGELVPKVFALRNQEWVCLRMSPAMRWFAFRVKRNPSPTCMRAASRLMPRACR